MTAGQTPSPFRSPANLIQSHSKYAAVIDEENHLFADAYERFDKQAFAGIQDHVVECWYDHKADMKLGTTALQGSLTLSVDENKNSFINSDSIHRTPIMCICAAKSHRACGGSSLGFRPTKHKWIKDGDKGINIIERCRVRDVGPTPSSYYKKNLSTGEK